MKRLLITALAGALSACEGSSNPAGPSPGQTTSPTGVLSGVVRSASSSQPIALASVMWAGLDDAWGGTGHGVLTDDKGRYRLVIQGLAGPGSDTNGIKVRAARAGYSPQVVQVNVVGIVTLDFRLARAFEK